MNHPTSTTGVGPMTAPKPIPLTIAESLEHSAALWTLSPEERVDAMWAGMLTLSQLSEWTRRRPSEVPRLGGEFAWIVMRMPEWDEPAGDRRDNVVHLPERRGTERAAA